MKENILIRGYKMLDFTENFVMDIDFYCFGKLRQDRDRTVIKFMNISIFDERILI